MATNANFEIDTVQMTNQPSEIAYTPKADTLTPMATGGSGATKYAEGAVVRVTWGVSASLADVLSELRTKRNSLTNHVIEFVDLTGGTVTLNVQWQSDPPYIMTPHGWNRPITVTFTERP